MNGDGVRLLPGEEEVSSEARTALETAFIGTFEDEASVEQAPAPVVVVGGALVAASQSREFRFPVMLRVERSDGGDLTMSLYDSAETLLLRASAGADTLTVNVLYGEKPLDASFASARFLELLATTPGVLYFDGYAALNEGEPALHRVEVTDLPLPMPEPWLEDHRNRVRLLEGLVTIWRNTGIEIRYPVDTEDEEGLRNYNFVQRAVRGGWVALSVASFDIHVSAAQARALLEELQTEGEIGRAFYLEVPTESYRVFGQEVNLGPSGRYLAAATLRTSREEIEAQLNSRSGNAGTVDLVWEPMGDIPMHVFFDQWPRSSVDAIRQDLREYEAMYEVRSRHFKRAWEQNESWTREIPDGSRWFSLIEADEEIAAES